MIWKIVPRFIHLSFSITASAALRLLLSTAYTHSKMILMCSAFCRCWDLEVKRSAKTLKKPALSRVLIKCYGRSYAVAGLFVFLLVGAGGERRRVSSAVLISSVTRELSWKALLLVNLITLTMLLSNLGLRYQSAALTVSCLLPGTYLEKRLSYLLHYQTVPL